MAPTEDRAPEGVVLDAGADARSRTFAVGSEEGEARWWFGSLATIKATREQTRGHYTLVEVLNAEGEGPPHVHYLRGRGLLDPRGRADLRGRRGEDKGRTGVVRLRSEGRPPPLHRGVGTGEAVVH